MMEDADKEGKQREGSDEEGIVGVGKKILVGGLLASSAALLLPPLVVVSVIGISVSLPYAIFLASHACTHNLMTKLLPMPNVLHRGKLSQDAIIHTSICEQEKASDHSPQLQVKGNVEEFVAADHDEDEKKTKGLLEKIRDNDANASDQRIELGDDDMNIGVDDSHTPIPSEQESQRRDYTNAADETGFHLFNFKEMSTEPQDYTNAIDLHQESSNVVVVDEHMHTDPMEHDVLCVQQQHKSAKDTEKHVKEMNSVNEKIWKEMNAIRLIVGYEETPQASCIDELKNLYIFTGVEPPTLLNHSCTLLEINDKLHFLLSILGVKSSVP